MQTESDRHADVGVGCVVVVRDPVVVHAAEVRGIAGVSGEQPPVRAVIKSSLAKTELSVFAVFFLDFAIFRPLLE